ncbi:MAG: DNA polymerase I, partial [Alphaproteobacteria bacterium]|nr:DNA polymerase I [Alphaproteobacteria bacterium]
GAVPQPERPPQLAVADVLAPLKALVEDAAVLKIGHNIKYDLVVLAAACRRHLPGAPPLAPAAIDDTMLMSYVLDAGHGRHNLDEVSSATLGHTTIKYDAVTGTGKERISFAEVALDRARDYAAEDADMTLRLDRALRRRLIAERVTTVYETIERPLVPVIAAMEQAGIRVDAARLKDLSAGFARRMAALEEQAQALAGGTFNIGSPKQLGEVLFERMGLQGGRKGKAGAWTTDADVLEELAAQGHDLPQVVLDWRQLQKLKSTYADALVEQINPETGRVHTAYGMAIAQTGRLSSTDPNLQNIPVRTEEGRKIRQAFVATDGHRLVSLDYSQIELRVLAHAADIEALVEAFRQGIDIHALTASMVFGVPVEGMDPLLRRRAKAINFGIIYGISPFGLARNLGIERGEARAWIDAYFARYPGIRAYMDRTVKQAREQGFVETIFGRRIHLAGIADRNPARRGFAERQAINAPIQGAAADIIKRAMIRVPAALARDGLGAKMLLQVHDELLFEVPEAEVAATVAAVKDVMENATLPALVMKVPLVADAGIGRTWDEAH